MRFHSFMETEQRHSAAWRSRAGTPLAAARSPASVRGLRVVPRPPPLLALARTTVGGRGAAGLARGTSGPRVDRRSPRRARAPAVGAGCPPGRGDGTNPRLRLGGPSPVAGAARSRGDRSGAAQRTEPLTRGLDPVTRPARSRRVPGRLVRSEASPRRPPDPGGVQRVTGRRRSDCPRHPSATTWCTCSPPGSCVHRWRRAAPCATTEACGIGTGQEETWNQRCTRHGGV